MTSSVWEKFFCHNVDIEYKIGGLANSLYRFAWYRQIKSGIIMIINVQFYHELSFDCGFQAAGWNSLPVLVASSLGSCDANEGAEA